MRRALAFVLGYCAIASCSSLAPIPSPQECTNDTECDQAAGEVCTQDTNICVPGRELPPRRHLGFDIQESSGPNVLFRAEVDGCDREVFLESSSRELSIERRWYAQRLELDVLATELEPDVDVPTPPDVVPSTFFLEQASRFAYRDVDPRNVNYPTFADEMMMLLSPTVVQLARYHPDDVLSPAMGHDASVVWRVVPTEGEMPRASLYRLLQVPLTQQKECTPGVPEGDLQCCINPLDPEGCEIDPNTCEDLNLCTVSGNPRFKYRFLYQDDCSRTMTGDLRLVLEDGTLAPLPGATVNLLHADDPMDGKLGVFALDDREDQCEIDEECATGQYCDASRCRLALAGRSATTPRTSNEQGGFEATIYTYADERDEPLGCEGVAKRSFTATVASPNGAYPSVQYEFSVDFRPIEGTKPVAQLVERLCLPDWGPPITAELALTGEGVTLVGSGADAFRCCDVGCLPATADELGMITKPPSDDTCNGSTAGGAFPRASVEAPAMLEIPEDDWTALGCMMPVEVDDRIGTFASQADCSGIDGTSCTLTNLGAQSDGTGREYQLRIESPVGSVLQSLQTTIVVDAASQPEPFQQDITLEPRVLVRGMVRVADDLCDPATAADTDCGSERAIVLAERLRMPGEDPAEVVGPFFHQVQTFYDPIARRPGAYVLPLDRGGVYLITALPAAGSQGGPAPIDRIDLREGTEDRVVNMVLPAGVLVTLDVGTFDSRAAAFTPLDRGSWSGTIEHPGKPGEFVDLNAIGECLTPPDEGPLACKIRRLIPGASLTGSQVGQLRFTARAASEAAASCPGG